MILLPQFATSSKRRRKTNAGRKMFLRTYWSQGGMCACCRKVLPPELLTRDHIKPRCRKGARGWTNIQLLCAPCNHRKDARELRY